jgi:DeoR family fructose operon transcriptional repressor
MSTNKLSPRMMLTAERHHAILRLLSEHGRVTVAEIAQRFKISSATARRDAAALAKTGGAARGHGGLLPPNFFRDERAPRSGVACDTSVTARIARRATDLLPHEGSIFVDAGTTCLAVGRLLLARPELRISTNSIPLLALASESQAILIGIGGEGKKGSDALTGALSQAWLAHLRFDAAVLEPSGVDLTRGAYTNGLGEAAIKTEVLRRSAIRVLVADGEKWNNSSGVNFSPWSGFTSFVTNLDLPREARLALAVHNVKVYRA